MASYRRLAGAMRSRASSKARARRRRSICAQGDIANMGFARAARRPGRAGRRHRPRRRDRRGGRHARRARSGRRRHDPRLRHQQIPRRSRACSPTAMRRSRRCRAGAATGSCPGSPPRRACRARTPWCWSAAARLHATRKLDRLPDPAAHRQFRRPRPAEARAGRRGRVCSAGSADSRRSRARRAARL